MIIPLDPCGHLLRALTVVPDRNIRETTVGQGRRELRLMDIRLDPGRAKYSVGILD